VLDPSAEQIADARLRDAQNLRGLHLCESAGRDRLLQLDQQVRADEHMPGFFRGEPEIAKYVARRRRDLHVTFSWHLPLAS
jgi:hypothetical protein